MSRKKAKSNCITPKELSLVKLYLPSRGTASEVGGMISASRRKKTVSERRIDMHRVTWG